MLYFFSFFFHRAVRCDGMHPIDHGEYMQLELFIIMFMCIILITKRLQKCIYTYCVLTAYNITIIKINN